MPAFHGRPSDDLAQGASAVTATTEDADYPAENLIDTNIAKPAKLTGTSGNWVVDLGSARTVAAASIVNHTIDAGLEVRLQGNSADSWGAPAFNEAFAIPTHHEDGHAPNPILLVGATYRYWRLIVVGTNSQNVAVGRLLLLGAWREFGTSVQFSAMEDEEHLEHVDETELGVELVYDHQMKRRSLSGEMPANALEVEEIASLRRDAHSRVYGWALQPFEGVNDLWFVRFSDDRRSQTIIAPDADHGGYHRRVRFQVREVSPGVPFP